MAETNPLFQAPSGVSFDTSMGLSAQANELHVGLEIESVATTVAQAVSAKSHTAATLRGEREMFVFELEPPRIYPSTKGLVRALLTLEVRPLEYITLDEMVAWQPVRYESRRMTTSEATAFSNIDLRSGSGPRVLKHLTHYLRSIFRPAYGAALADRIEALSEMVREESDGSMDLSGASLANLIALLERNTKMMRPRLVAGPSGEVIAIWKRAETGEFVGRFLPNGTVKYLLTTPNPQHPQGVTRVSGDTTPDKLFSEARLAEYEE